MAKQGCSMNRLTLASASLLLIACGNRSTELSREILVDSTSLVYDAALGENAEELCLAGVTDAFFISDDSIVVIEYVRGAASIIDLNTLEIYQIGRQGPGPNEYTRPIHGCLIENDMIAISDTRGQVLYYIGTMLNSLIADTGMFYPFNIRSFGDSGIVGRVIELKSSDEGLIAVTSIVIFENERRKTIWSDGGKSIDFSSANDLLEMVFLNVGFSRGMSKSIFIAQRDANSYLVSQYDLNGDEIGRIKEDVDPVEKEDSAKEEEAYVMESLSRMAELEGAPVIWEPEPQWSQIIEVDVGPDGNVWIRRGTTSRLTYDIYSPQGIYQRTLVLPDRTDTRFWVTHMNRFGIIAYDLHPERSDVIHLIRFRR
jgi:hypothetical protein